MISDQTNGPAKAPYQSAAVNVKSALEISKFLQQSPDRWCQVGI